MFESMFINSRCNVLELIFFNVSKCVLIIESSKSKNVSFSILTICSLAFTVLMSLSSILSKLESSSIILPVNSCGGTRSYTRTTNIISNNISNNISY